ncbi:hypothetical protein C731_4916 [Mycolicibacterium hassiacum DSM 44199]|jgi:hypothetical protein|uniref:Uncharacterized protein n=1 Tax=Mycolicibacterium hassiacum (strain DSM 44199 / CIP 105218 / JCM 12690 / 3849) TaxID=1122247 RepID=K5BCV4_MYCHD|nr:hypothetical protein [Mycolicibacterium hassiacum]EKF21111.1 hypothetical protein C731_4916 [Mycolicibacterium hassiacum DSM 44199]MBX5488292.1 hypothetical protein [Mycolicibacterium hassiacum]MDA4084806.1 hypothetical protein [Mycolicibacterium hassiacum DSM 44199]PZN17805.1 MAG: hypothetical protein DIU75_18450 [Mycolicibacterium hassiacum]VCT90025.1 hypothetical protein MHAS_01725 [Mycolicibacterium hassiacum DSM 44199]
MRTDRFAWWRLVGGGVLVLGLTTGPGVVTASAQPAEPTETPVAADEKPKSCTGRDCKREHPEPPRINADALLAQIHSEYRQGDGGGQISKLIDDAVKLRRQGFRPSYANAVALAEALEARPNQIPLIEALKETIAYQRKQQAQAQMSIGSNAPAVSTPIILPDVGINLPQR